MPTPDFRFVIDAVFDIPGRGTVVAGTVTTGRITSGDPACLYMDGGIFHVDSVWIDSLGGLLLRGVRKEQVPPGAILKPCDHGGRADTRRPAEGEGQAADNPEQSNRPNIPVIWPIDACIPNTNDQGGQVLYGDPCLA